MEAAPHTWCQEREACAAVQKEEHQLSLVPTLHSLGCSRPYPYFLPLPLLFAPYPYFFRFFLQDRS